jgi:hypothetical protein
MVASLQCSKDSLLLSKNNGNDWRFKQTGYAPSSAPFIRKVVNSTRGKTSLDQIIHIEPRHANYRR